MSTNTTKETAVLAAGCFWGVQELLRAIPGVIRTEVGYTGGTVDNPTYNDVKTGRSGHAEAILVEFDSQQLSFKGLLELFFRLHDPTTLNRQGNDIGSQYRSAIFTLNEDQRKTALQVIEEVNQSGRWTKSLATRIEPFKKFHSAEAEHQDYLQRNPGGYTCHFWRE